MQTNDFSELFPVINFTTTMAIYSTATKYVDGKVYLFCRCTRIIPSYTSDLWDCDESSEKGTAGRMPSQWNGDLPVSIILG
jgi:hypothetical protein